MKKKMSSIEKEFYYYRLYCMYKYNGKKIRAKICWLKYKHYEEKHLQEFLKS